MEIYLSIFKRFLSRNNAKLGAPREAAGCLGAYEICRFEIFDLRGELAGIRRGIEMSNETYAAFPGNQRLPEGLSPNANWRYNSHPGDYDAPLHSPTPLSYLAPMVLI